MPIENEKNPLISLLDHTRCHLFQFQMEGVSKTVLITVGGPIEDETKPAVKAEYGVECAVARNETACKNTQWHVEFHVRDQESGLRSLEVQAIGRDSILHPSKLCSCWLLCRGMSCFSLADDLNQVHVRR